MLDTGIDMPEVVNLVFFKLVRSKTKFWQMLGRGTRLCPDLFGPGQDKEFFYVFDYCQNLEYFSQDIPATEGALGESLGKRLFNARLELIGELDERPPSEPRRGRRGAAASYGDPTTDDEVRRAIAELLHREVAAMNLDNFVVRPQRRAGREVRQARGLGDAVGGGARASCRTRWPGCRRSSTRRARRPSGSTCCCCNLQLALLRVASPASSGCAIR